MRKQAFPALCARLVERKSHCRKNSPSNLARHWPGWGADATLPIGGSTARVAPLSAPLPTAPRSHHRLCLSRPSTACPLLLLYTHHGNTSVTLSPPCRPRRFSRSARRPCRLHAPSRSHGVRISPTRSPPLPSPFRARPCSLSSLPPVSLSHAFDRAYISLMRLPLFFFPLSLSLPRPFSTASVSLARTGREIRSNTRGDVPSTPCAVCRRGA